MEMIFREGFTLQDLSFITMIIEQINPHLSSPLTMSEMKKGIGTIVKVTAENKDILQAAIPKIQKMYARLEEKEQEIKQLTYDKAILQGKIIGLTHSKNDLKEILKEKMHQPVILIEGMQIDNTNTLNIGGSIIDKRTYHFSSPSEADKVAREIIEQLCFSEDTAETLTQLDQEISSKLESYPEKKKWLTNAFQKSKDSLKEISDQLTPVLQGASGGFLFEILKAILF